MTVFADVGNERSEARGAERRKNPYPAAKKRKCHQGAFFFCFELYRDSNKEGANEVCGRKQSCVTVFADVGNERSEARGAERRKNPYPAANEEKSELCHYR
ncbi:MAG: hypothetical protein ACI4VW_08005 [Acutalibacteraceae bacterium]